MKKIAFILFGLVLAFGTYITYVVYEKFEFVDKAIDKSRVSADNKSMITQKIELINPDNSIEFFKDLKSKSEEYWKTIELNEDIYGFQTQKGTLWNKGLTEEQIDSFETELGIKFPEGLKNYYRVMNGVNLPAINIYGNSGEKSTYTNNFYSYPEDVAIIKEKIQWIYESNHLTVEELNEKGIARIFPVFGHRFLLLDGKGLVLSMYGDDIIYWTDNISKLLAIEIFEGRELPSEFKENQSNIDVKFWLD
ncbi:MAG: SMI1/KNR4 family protein [Cyclobacteriaceae bacterium]|nr:SMI1/KNR4 family protein [Cyclobacteriaceae bacterium]